jgi:hypothetical protein
MQNEGSLKKNGDAKLHLKLEVEPKSLQNLGPKVFSIHFGIPLCVKL